MPLLVVVSGLAACVAPRIERRLDDERQRAGALVPVSALTDDVAGLIPTAPSEPLSWPAVTEAVLQRNPRLESARAAWRAMLERVPQVTASPDPTLEVGLGPLSLPTGRGQRVAWRHPLAWGATLDARADAVLADAEALGHEREALRRQLVASTHEALVELGAAAALRALYHSHHQLVTTLRAGALARVAAGRGLPEDALTAEAELIMVDREVHDLDRVERVARARLNALLHRPPDAPLGVATLPATLPPEPPPVAELVAQAELARPELAAADARIAARAADTRVADTMDRPMFGLGAELSTMSDDPMMWPMLMVMIELPLASARREGMQAEARAMLAMQRAERARLMDDIGLEVATMHAELTAARAQLATTTASLVPLLQQRVELGIASYAAAREDFDDVVMASTALLEARIDVVMFTRAAHLAAIRLELALGRLVGLAAPTKEPPP